MIAFLLVPAKPDIRKEVSRGSSLGAASNQNSFDAMRIERGGASTGGLTTVAVLVDCC